MPPTPQKFPLSRWALLVALLLVAFTRFNYHTNNSTNGYNATSWDAFGYYLYLPGLFIYDDLDKLAWVEKVDSTYQVTGGHFYQATPLENGNYAGKYLNGVAIMELPFFFIGHGAAGMTGYPQDGFSAPYQYAIMWGAVCWFAIGLIFLRKVLLAYYSETVTAITLLMVVMATNLVQYVAVDGAMSHAFIFPLYAMMLYYSMRWATAPKMKYAFAIGLILGIATVSRPTELIMLFIPLFWLTPDSGSLKEKWKLLFAHKSHLAIVAGAFTLCLIPQLIYWKYVTGSFVYDVGSKWYFLNPWWRVLIGFEKGWFIYTPITVLFVAGLFFLKQKPFRLAVIVFCVLNIWIVIAWHEWQYGASYSARALTQSYPVFALAFAAVVHRIIHSKFRWVALPVGVYLVILNLFQTWQYNLTMLHYADMNAAYYRAIYLDADPTPLDYSLLDTDEQIDEPEMQLLKPAFANSFHDVALMPETMYSLGTCSPNGATAAAVSLTLETPMGAGSGVWNVYAYKDGAVIKENQFRLALPFVKENPVNHYEHHFFIPEKTDSVVWRLQTFGEMKIAEGSLQVSLRN